MRSEFGFEPSSKRRKGFLSETRVKRGFPRCRLWQRTFQKLDRNDP